MTTKKKTKPRKLLVASIGLATLTIGQGCLTSGNLIAPPPTDSGIHRDAGQDSGPPGFDAGPDSGSLEDAGGSEDAGTVDAGTVEDAGAADDAGASDDAGAVDAG